METMDLLEFNDVDSEINCYYLPSPPQTPLMRNVNNETHNDLLPSQSSLKISQEIHEMNNNNNNNNNLQQKKNYIPHRQRSNTFPQRNHIQKNSNNQNPNNNNKFNNQSTQQKVHQNFTNPNQNNNQINNQNRYLTQEPLYQLSFPQNQSQQFQQFQQLYRQIQFPKQEFLQSYSGNQNEYHPRMTYQQRKSNSQHSKLQQKKDKSIQNNKRSKDIPHLASYIKSWQTNNPCAQIHLVKIEFGDYNEFNNDKVTEFNNHNIIIKNTADINFDDDNNFDGFDDTTIKEDYLTQVTRRGQKDKNKCNNRLEIGDRRFGPPKFRYKYSSDAIQLCLLRNVQIWIPLKSLKSIEKKDKRVFKLELKTDSIARNLISCQFDFYYSEIKKALIEENIKKTRYITMITHKEVNETELDIIGLHIDYLVKMLNADNQHDSIFLSWGAVGWGSQVQKSSSRSSQAEGKQIQSFNHINKENEWIIKYNVIDDTRIFRFRAFTKFRTIKETIKEAFQSPFIKEFKYKDDMGEFITISNDNDFSIAFRYYAKKNKLEIWHF
ncbi:hypothetical protein Glove_415g28 [Diversispora epigaea]|uniref:PB1 domain-containing protein n=1 Tax=Diversispora epigaea TaxID=1348612 RepID=A0A397GWT4_9GLOM|nr:hypothetical protein Glove_415g28 [Diversispora epigaea]